MNFMKLTSLVVLLCLLTSCVSEEVIPEDTQLTISTRFSMHQFTLAGLPSYVNETDVYRLNTEEEVALMAYIQLLDEKLTFNYISDEMLNLDRTYAYLESLVPFSFMLKSSQSNYSQKGEIVLSLYTIEIDPIFDEWIYVDDYALDIIEQANMTQNSRLETIQSIHDVIILNTEYDESILDLDLSQVNTHLSFDSLGVFLENTAVCSGYSRAFSALSTQLDIPSLIVSSVSMTHAWNLVYDGHEWLFIDVTFDDPIPDQKGRVLYTYFLLNEDEFSADGKHVFDLSSDVRLDAQDYIDFANYVYFNE